MKIINNMLYAGRSVPTNNLADWGTRSGACGAGCPDCGDTTSCFPKRVDARFESQLFTLSAPFAPKLTPAQQCWGNSLASFPATAWMIAVPQEHKLVDLALRIEPGFEPAGDLKCDKASIGIGTGCARPDCCHTHPAGVQFEVVTELWDNDTMAPADTSAAPVVVATMTGLDLMHYKFVAPVDFHHNVPSCHTLLVGIRFLSGPSNDSVDGNGLGCIPSRITPIAGIRGYDQILQQG